MEFFSTGATNTAAGILYGGTVTGSLTAVNETEVWNGSTWTEVNGDLNTS